MLPVLCRRRAVAGLIVTAVIITVAAVLHAAAPARRHVSHTHRRGGTHPAPPVLPCGTVFDFQVRLDRAGYSPGQIDGELGDNFTHTVAAFQATHRLEPSGNAECHTWAALGGDTAPPSATSYRLTEAD